MADNPQDKAQIIQMGSVTNPVPVTGQVWFDGSHLWMNIGGTSYRMDNPVTTAWTATGVTPVRLVNPSLATTISNAQLLGTLIQDLQASGIVG